MKLPDLTATSMKIKFMYLLLLYFVVSFLESSRQYFFQLTNLSDYYSVEHQKQFKLYNLKQLEDLKSHRQKLNHTHSNLIIKKTTKKSIFLNWHFSNHSFSLFPNRQISEYHKAVFFPFPQQSFFCFAFFESKVFFFLLF